MRKGQTNVRRCTASFVFALLAAVTLAQEAPQRIVGNEDVKIIKPTADNAAGKVTIPGAFWNQKLADWVEVAMCGRPSDFLHETLICATTTRAEMEKALRAAGFHDADAWADSIKDFPRIRGDRMLITVSFTRDGKVETYALDELLTFQGWGTAIGPYGFMFKGDPERATKASTMPVSPFTPPPATAPAGAEPDSLKILRDDPQIALVFKGLQSMSQSMADHPLAYDDWIYPMLNFGRNYSALPPAVLNSNGQIPITISLEKVSDEQLLKRSAELWHDDGWRAEILKHVDVAKEIDTAKAALWSMHDELAKLRDQAAKPDTATTPPPALLRAEALRAKIERGYATLDAAWAAYGAAHAKFAADDPRVLEQLKAEAKLWSQHLELTRVSAEQRAIAADLRATNDATAQASRPTSGKILSAQSAALAADTQQELGYWKDQWSRLDPAKDPRVDWIKSVRLQVELADARQAAAQAGASLGTLLQSAGQPTPEEQAAAQAYRTATTRIALADIRLKLAGIEFEISKRETFDNDPDLPRLRESKQQLDQQLKALEATTQPAGR